MCEWSGEEGGGGRGGRRVVCCLSTLCEHILLHTPTSSHLHTLTQYSQALRSVTAKLFADLEIKKKHLEDRDQSER